MMMVDVPGDGVVGCRKITVGMYNPRKDKKGQRMWI